MRAILHGMAGFAGDSADRPFFVPEGNMTTKETAESLGISERVVQKHARELGLTENGKTTNLDEKAVTIIKTKVERSGRTDLAQVCELPNVTTDLEMMVLDAKVSEWKTRKIEELQKQLAASESRVIRLIHNNTTYTSGEIAKEIGMKSAQELHEVLHEKGIIFKDARGVWQLYSEYAGRGFQNIKQRVINGAPRYYAEWTGVGRDWLIGLFSKAVAN
jgi:phage antirepressor YoqD-like protein